MLLPDCARKGRLEMVKFLIDTVAIDPNFAGRQNMTALHFASRGGNVGIVKWMLDSCPSIDVNALDRAGKKPVDYAIANEKDEIVSLLSPCLLCFFGVAFDLIMFVCRKVLMVGPEIFLVVLWYQWAPLVM